MGQVVDAFPNGYDLGTGPRRVCWMPRVFNKEMYITV